jgi:hypothetical protein
MNVTSVGATPAPIPAPLPVQRPVAPQNAPDAGSRDASQRPAQARKPEPEPVRLPPLKPVSTQEFRVMLGALPPSALSRVNADAGAALDLYA